MPSIDELKSYATAFRRATRNEHLIALCDFVLGCSAAGSEQRASNAQVTGSSPAAPAKPKRDRAAYMRNYRRRQEPQV